MIRLARAGDATTTLARVTTAFAEAQVGVSELVQDGSEIVLVTERCETGRIDRAVAAIEAEKLLARSPKRLRILEESP